MAYDSSSWIDPLTELFSWITIALGLFVYFCYYWFRNTKKNKCKDHVSDFHATFRRTHITWFDSLRYDSCLSFLDWNLHRSVARGQDLGKTNHVSLQRFHLHLCYGLSVFLSLLFELLHHLYDIEISQQEGIQCTLVSSYSSIGWSDCCCDSCLCSQWHWYFHNGSVLNGLRELYWVRFSDLKMLSLG